VENTAPPNARLPSSPRPTDYRHRTPPRQTHHNHLDNKDLRSEHAAIRPFAIVHPQNRTFTINFSSTDSRDIRETIPRVSSQTRARSLPPHQPHPPCLLIRLPRDRPRPRVLPPPPGSISFC